MKKCIRCSKLFDNEINYCTNCGSSNFYEEDENSFQVDEGTEELSRYTEKVFANNSQSNVNSHVVTEKKKNWWKIISIAIVSILLFFVVIMIIPVDETSDDNSYSDTSTEIEKVDYSKGSVVDGCYLNEWANISFPIPEGWTESAQEEYQLYEDVRTDCGFVAERGNNKLVVCFEDLPINVSEEEYLEVLKEGLIESYREYDVNFDTTDAYAITLAGIDYKVIKVTIGNDILHQYMCVRKIEDYMVFISVNTEADDEAQTILYSIEEYNNY